ncbi:transaldolase [Iamia majanohamensis]|uniref:Transaldolase n=1 Tax=Iamia majanohamensis TaxID=467976 RepID=A0AAE9Y918_9ACTN|nr:transaldolase [Iamia majanohamensis]WCO69184.1 transaldolase [Iamia majanohamensis]
MTRLHELHDDQGQSPWLDNLRRSWIQGGDLADWVDRGVRGITSNPSIFQKAIAGSADYDDQFASCLDAGMSVEDTYWDLVVTDIEGALAVLRPVYDASGGGDGFVSVEVAPSLARDTEGTARAALDLHQRIAEPNLYVKIPGTAEGLPAIQKVIAQGHSVNVTLLFSLSRYGEVIEAHQAGLEELVASGASAEEVARVSSVASFFVSRVDAEVDRRLEVIGTEAATALKGRAAVANARLAYRLFRERYAGPRWEALAAAGAQVQRPLWASTSTKDPSYPDTLYVDSLIGPDTVNTLPDATLEAFLDHGTVARTVDTADDEALRTLDELADVGVDLDDVTQLLEKEGVEAFEASYDDLLSTLGEKAEALRPGSDG